MGVLGVLRGMTKKWYCICCHGDFWQMCDKCGAPDICSHGLPRGNSACNQCTWNWVIYSKDGNWDRMKKRKERFTPSKEQGGDDEMPELVRAHEFDREGHSSDDEIPELVCAHEKCDCYSKIGEVD